MSKLDKNFVDSSRTLQERRHATTESFERPGFKAFNRTMTNLDVNIVPEGSKYGWLNATMSDHFNRALYMKWEPVPLDWHPHLAIEHKYQDVVLHSNQPRLNSERYIVNGDLLLVHTSLDNYAYLQSQHSDSYEAQKITAQQQKYFEQFAILEPVKVKDSGPSLMGYEANAWH